MNTKTKITADFFPGLDGILSHKQLSNSEKIIAFAYCKLLNPWRKFLDSDTSYHKIAEITAISYETVKKLAPKVMLKLPEYFQRSPREYGKSYKYIFKMSINLNLGGEVSEPVNTQSDFIGETSYTNEDLQKLAILQKLGNFPREWYEPLIRFSLTEIKFRVEYLLEMAKKKGIGLNGSRYKQLHWNYILDCFNNQRSFKSIREMNNKDKQKYIQAYDSRINDMITDISSKTSFNKGAA